MIEASVALYVHMPWCVRKCPYCDFNSHQLNTAQPDASYIDTLLADFDLEAPSFENRKVDTVFFGGGTPSLFRPEEFARFIHALRQRIELAGDAEITLEANPGTIERGSFRGYAEAGINRVSLGAQSFDDRALRALGRIHAADDTRRAVEDLRAAGIDNFNLDLMYALPQQTLEEASADVASACALNPSHISYYHLTLEPGTVFHARPPLLPDDELAWLMQCAGQSLLADAGFAQYEVSAYARRGAQCRHNLNYWSFGDYVGVGAGAHGKVSERRPDQILRTAKPKQPREYQAQIRGATAATGALESRAIGARALIAPAELPFEFMLNALRLNDGFSAEQFRQNTGLELSAVEGCIVRAVERGLLEQRGTGWRASALGWRFLNDLQLSFLP